MVGLARDIKRVYSELARKKHFWIWLGVFIMLELLDTLSTLRFVSVLGIESEGNVMARWFFSEFGLPIGNILFSLTIVPLITGLSLYFFWKIYNRFFWHFMWLINILMATVVIGNYLAV